MTKLHMLMLLSLLFAYLVYLQANEHYNAFFHGKPLDKISPSSVASLMELFFSNEMLMAYVEKITMQKITIDHSEK